MRGGGGLGEGLMLVCWVVCAINGRLSGWNAEVGLDNIEESDRASRFSGAIEGRRNWSSPFGDEPYRNVGTMMGLGGAYVGEDRGE
jgi:hypothetical protein